MGVKRVRFRVLGIIIFCLAVGVVLVQTAKPVFALEDSGESQISVDVSQKLWIDITPESMSWTNSVDPGSLPDCDVGGSCIGASLGTGASHSVYAIEIENIGSVNITHIWLNNTMPTSNPFASGKASSYDPANFLAVSFQNDTNYHFVNRKEYAMPRKPVYLQVPASVDGDKTGRLRSANNERYWALIPGDGTACNSSGTEFFVTTGEVHNETNTGDIDLSDETSESINPCSQDGSLGCGNVTTNINGEAQDYALVVENDCSAVTFVRYNADMATLHGAGNMLSDDGYLHNSASGDGPFTPGNYTPMFVESRIPYGTAQGSLATGYLTVLADNT